MTRLFLMAGHGGSSPGAVWHGRKEATEAIKLVDKVYQLVLPHVPKDHKIIKVPHSLDYKNGADWVKARLGKNDIVLDIHFNAFSDQRATGTETLYKGAKGFAQRVQTNTHKTLAIRSRGLKYRDDLYLLNLLPYSAALLEVCFLSNKSDMATYDKKGAQAVANAVYSVLKASNVVLPKVTSPPPIQTPMPTPPKVSEPAKLAQPVTYFTRLGAKLVDAKTGKVIKTYTGATPWTAYATFTWNGIDFYQTEYSYNAKSWSGVAQSQFAIPQPVHNDPPDSEVSMGKQIKEVDDKLDELTERVTTIERLVRAIVEFLSATFKNFK